MAITEVAVAAAVAEVVNGGVGEAEAEDAEEANGGVGEAEAEDAEEACGAET